MKKIKTKKGDAFEFQPIVIVVILLLLLAFLFIWGKDIYQSIINLIGYIFK